MRKKREQGLTLVEMMVALAVMSVGVLGTIGAFLTVQRAIHVSKTRTFASTLAQEKIQILKQMPYHRIMVTSDTAHSGAYSAIPHDETFFPSETILEGGLSFKRLTLVQMAKEDSGEIITLPPIPPDTGMKLITVVVAWWEKSTMKTFTLKNIKTNFDTVVANASVTGSVEDPDGVAINGALVTVAENVGWRDSTDASGEYRIDLSPGSFNLSVTASGYYGYLGGFSVAENQTLPLDITLTRISSGTVSGAAWVNPKLLISQVVASTHVWASGSETEREVEFIELFNPTPNAIDIGTTGDPKIRIDYDCEAAGQDHPHADFNFVFLSTYVGPGRSYLLANATAMILNGDLYIADACWGSSPGCNTNPTYPDYIDKERASSIRLRRYSDNNVYDTVGWDDNNNSACVDAYCEGTAIPNYTAGGFDGLGAGYQLIRRSSPSFVSEVYGRAYDTDNNANDFYYPSTEYSRGYAPHNSAYTVQTVISGKPAFGAVVSASDSLSVSTAAYLSGSPAQAVFSLINVATGTWSVYITSGNYLLSNDTVTIASSGSTYVFPSSTTLLAMDNSDAFISGTVLDVTNQPINPSITVSPGGAGPDGLASIVNGRYFLRVTPGLLDVTANPNNLNSSYVSQSSASIVAELGMIHSDVDFILSQGGRASGFITRDGANGIPSYAVTLLDSEGIARDVPVTGTDGRFTSLNVATGTYSVEPVLSSREASTPASASVDIAAGSTVFSATFTISGALGTLSGSATIDEDPIRTGVTVVVTTNTIVSSPPVLNSSLLDCYYITSTQENGTYSVDVPSGTYNAYAYYSTVSNSGSVAISSRSVSGISVLPGYTTPGADFAW